MDNTLNNILNIAGLAEEEQKDFKQAFYKNLVFKLLITISASNKKISQALESAISKKNIELKEINTIIEKAYKEPELKEKIDTQLKHSLTELTDTVLKSANSSQKQQLATLLSH